MATRKTLVEETVTYCDICGSTRGGFIECAICKKTVCRTCRQWNHCTNCWNKNEYYGRVEVIEKEDPFFTVSSSVSYRLVSDSNKKLYDLLSRFHGKRVKISFEEIKTEEKSRDKHHVQDK